MDRKDGIAVLALGKILAKQTGNGAVFELTFGLCSHAVCIFSRIARAIVAVGGTDRRAIMQIARQSARAYNIPRGPFRRKRCVIDIAVRHYQLIIRHHASKPACKARPLCAVSRRSYSSVRNIAICIGGKPLNTIIFIIIDLANKTACIRCRYDLIGNRRTVREGRPYRVSGNAASTGAIVGHSLTFHTRVFHGTVLDGRTIRYPCHTARRTVIFVTRRSEICISDVKIGNGTIRHTSENARSRLAVFIQFSRADSV